jgi:type II secretory ATPase GspE/PulE/Tfp pilus assembly ATPase PilB-like protein
MRTRNKEENTYVEEAPLIQLVSQLLLKAHEMGASDVHLEPLQTIFRIRFRIDGVLQEVQQLPKKLERAVISRLKIMTSSMNIAEKRLPQDGRFHFHSGEISLDIRAATMPTLHGESMVLRLLNPTSHLLDLSQLGLESGDQLIFKKILQQPDGLVLITGPTGSGKTTTLYSCLKELQQSACKIITVEDPIEYRLHGINQVQTKEEIGLTFPRVLRAILRQAPNKIIVGEIRDRETAQIAMNASLTGHLILSTLHANDAPSAIARLADMEIAPFLIASGLRAIIAQRLVRRLCFYCKEPTVLSEYEKKALQLDEKIFAVMKAVGCSKCHGKGFRGRLGIFEILLIDGKFRHLIHQQAPTSELRNYARGEGMHSLREDGLRKMEAGLTTAQEVISSALIGESDKAI